MYPADSKILIVEDSPFSRKTIKDSLRQLGFDRVIEAENGEVAQTMLLDKTQILEPVHLIISDLNMPAVDGIAFLRWVRKQPMYQGLPVIILTAEQEKNAVLEAVNLGISHYMIKPFDLATLRERLDTTWHKHGRKYYEGRKVS